MEPTDLTLRVLQEIRDEQRATRGEIVEMKGAVLRVNDRLTEMQSRSDARFEVIETTLRDLAQQMVMMSRAVKVALESRSDFEKRLTDLEHRMDVVEKPAH
jgi:predicted  nucleic acid-binding Zn-ribbon protein